MPTQTVMDVPASRLTYPMPGLIPGNDTMVIRPLEVPDTPRVVAAVERSLRELKAFMPWAHYPQTLDSQRERIINAHAEYWKKEDSAMGVVAEPSGIHLGGTGLHPRTLNSRGLEIGYWINTEYAGKGLATLVTRCLIVYGFSYLGLDRIQCGHDLANIASARVNEKCGFKVEGTFRNFETAPTPAMLADGWQGSPKSVLRALVPGDIPSLTWFNDIFSNLVVYDWLGHIVPRPV